MEGFVFTNFKLLSLIGEGSFGKVFKAAENETKNVVALKVLTKVSELRFIFDIYLLCNYFTWILLLIFNPIFISLQQNRSAKELAALKQEANIHQNLRHPNIIQLLSSFDTEKELVFVCEYAVSDLHKLLAKEGSLGEPKTQKLSYDLISALYYLHSHRILHRDLKPPNILLDKNYKAKLCDFGLARNMTLGTQILTSMKGTPLYMAPELLEGCGYGHETDLWSLGCIIYEMLAGETPFHTRSIMQLMKLIHWHCIKWPSFLSSNCITFLQGLLVNNPKKRMSWDDILEHSFVKGHILILDGDHVSDSPFTKPRQSADQQKNEKVKHATSIARINQLKRQVGGTVEDVMSSRDSIKVNMNLQSDMEETDNEEILLKNDSDGIETSGDGGDNFEVPLELGDERRPSMGMTVPGQFHNIQQFQLDPPRVHNIANFQPVAENSNMVMHRFLDNVDPEMQTFMMSPATMMTPTQFPMFPPANPVQKITQDLENFSLRMEKSVEAIPVAQSSSRKSIKTQSEGVSTDVSSVPVETEEWLQLLFKAMQEILDGDLEIYKQGNMMPMIVGLLRNPKFNSKLIDHVVQIICLPYAIDMPRSILEDIDKLYIRMKLVPNLVYASKLLCSKKFHQNSMETMSIPKVDKLIQFTEAELKSLSGIYDLVVFLIYSGETFLDMLCDAISILNLDHMFRSFIVCGTASDSEDAVRLTGSIIALICAVLEELPENANLIEKIIFHDDIDLCKLLRHDDAKIRLRTCLMIHLLGRFCCFSLQNQWNHELTSCLEELKTDVDDDVRNETMSIIEEFKDCVGWFKIENF